MDGKSKTIKQRYISSAFILLISTCAVKVISAVYKIPLTAYIGATGRGYFSVAYNLCMPIHALTMGAFPVALTKLVSSGSASGDYAKVGALRKAAQRLFLLVGLIGTTVMLAAAEPYANHISSSPKSIYTILALAPSVLFSCMSASHRSFAEGHLDMKPTAVSQIIEALFKAVFGLLFARYTMSYLFSRYYEGKEIMGAVCQSEEEALSVIYPVTSAAAMAGVTLGCLAGYIYCVTYSRIKYGPLRFEKNGVKQAFNELGAFAAPLVISTAIQSVSGFLDNASLQFCLSKCDAAALSALYNTSQSDIYTYVYGIYSSALDFKNLVPGIVMALGVTAVPAVSLAYESSKERFSSLLTSIFKYTTVLCAGGGLVLALFPSEILSLFYGSNNPDIASNASELLFLFGVTIFPCCAASTSVFCAQSLGFSQKTIMPFTVSAVVRVAMNFILVQNIKYNIKGAAYSNLVGFAIIFIWCLAVIIKKTNAKINFIDAFIKPVICAFAVYFASFYAKKMLEGFLSGFICLAASLVFCGVIYLLSMFLTGVISKNDIKSLN